MTAPSAVVQMTVAPSVPPAEICLDVRRGGTTVQMAWPVDVVASPPRVRIVVASL